MITVMLCATEREAREHVTAAGLDERDVILASSATAIEGLRLTRDDLVVEFPGFRHRADAAEVRAALDNGIRRNRPEDGQPEWAYISGSYRR